jgi:hypothetical protein
VECAPRVPRVFQPPMEQPRSAGLPAHSGGAAPASVRAGSATTRCPTDPPGRRARQRRRRARTYSGSRSRIRQTFSNENRGPESLLSIHCSASQRRRRLGIRQSSPRSARHDTASRSIAKASLTSQREVNRSGAISAGRRAAALCRVMTCPSRVVDLRGIDTGRRGGCLSAVSGIRKTDSAYGGTGARTPRAR